MSLVTCPSTVPSTLLSQADVDAFPGYNCNAFSGYLNVNGDDITDLSPLDGIRSVGGLSLGPFSPTYTNLENVFDGLEDNTGGIYWDYNDPNIQSIDGFHNLVSTGDNVDIIYFSALESITGFEKLEVVGWTLDFSGNPLLTAIPDFCSLHTIESSFYVLDNVALTEITGFRALIHVDWSMDFLWNDALTNLCGLEPFFTSNAGVYTGGGSFNVQIGGVVQTEQDIMGSPCGFEPLSCSPSPSCGVQSVKADCESIADCYWFKIGPNTFCDSCALGKAGDSCATDDECCSNNCKGNGTCK